jgi:threonine synthase
LSAARRAHADGTVPKDVPIISLACAHPAKFESAVEMATGQKPVLPPHMADLMTRPEKMQTIDANADAVKSLVLARKRSV